MKLVSIAFVSLVFTTLYVSAFTGIDMDFKTKIPNKIAKEADDLKKNEEAAIAKTKIYNECVKGKLGVKGTTEEKAKEDCSKDYNAAKAADLKEAISINARN